MAALLGHAFLIVLLCWTLALPSTAKAQASAKVQGVMLNADSMFRDTENEIMELEGHVQIVLQTQHIKADKARINFRTRQADLTGNVEIVSQKATVGGSAAYLDYENNTGIIYNGFVQSGPVIFAGSVLQKVGEDEYYVSDADYTTCTNCPNTWGFSGTNIRAELGGYAYIKNSFLKIFSVPVFWFPYLIVPLKSDRQSGLLTPGFEQSDSGGLAISESYFWAISRSTDATITVKNYEKRGLKGLLNYRYVLNENSFGEFNGAYIKDRVAQKDSRFSRYQSPELQGKSLSRWFIKYDHYYEMPEEYIQRAQLNLASDLQYPKDFPKETLNHGDSAMDNRVSLTKNTESQHYSLDTSYYVNLLQANPLAGNSDAVHRFPELRFSQTQQKLGTTNFVYSVDFDYVNFARAAKGYDDITNRNVPGETPYVNSNCNPNDPKDSTRADCRLTEDGSYDPTTDLLRTGQRTDLALSIYRPMSLGEYVDFLPKISYRETHYVFNAGNDPSNVRRYLRASVSAKTSMSRNFTMDEDNPKSTKYKHEFQPEIVGTAIPWIYHPKHPFFGTADNPDGTFYYSDKFTDADLASPYGIQFDYNDRIYDRGLITFVLNNKLIQKKWVSDMPEYMQIASLKIFQSYDLYQANLRNPTRDPWSPITTVLDMRFNRLQTYTTFNYHPYQKVTDISSRVRLSNEWGQFFQVALAKNYTIVPGEAVDPNSRTEDYTFSTGFISRYVNLMGKFVYNANWVNDVNRKKIKSWVYIAQFKPPGDCWLITIIQDQITGGETNIDLSFAFNFDGKPQVPYPPETLDKYGF